MSLPAGLTFFPMKSVLRPLFLQFALVLALVSGLRAEDSAELVALRTKAEQGNSIAQYNLGLAYAKGHGTTVDLPEAFVWLSLASDNGTRGPALDSTLEALSPSQLAEAKRRLDAQRLKAKKIAAPAPAAAKPAAAPTPAPAPVKTPAPTATTPAPAAPKPATSAPQPQAAAPAPAKPVAAKPAAAPTPAPVPAKTPAPAATTPAPAAPKPAAPAPQPQAAAAKTAPMTAPGAPKPAPVPVVNPLQAPLDEARQTISRLTAKNEELTAALLSKPAPDSAAEKLIQTEDKLATALRSYSLLRDENDSLKTNSENASAERIALGSQLEAAQSSIASLNDQLASANVLAAQASALQMQLRQTQNQLASVSNDNNQLRGRLAAVLPSPSLLASPTRPGSAPTALNTEPAAAFEPIPEAAVEIIPTPPPAVVTPSAPARASTPIDTSVERTHTVAAGETLSGIALRYYGKSVRWAEILDANRAVLRDERSLRVGMQLRIPALR